MHVEVTTDARAGQTNGTQVAKQESASRRLCAAQIASMPADQQHRVWAPAHGWPCIMDLLHHSIQCCRTIPPTRNMLAIEPSRLVSSPKARPASAPA